MGLYILANVTERTRPRKTITVIPIRSTGRLEDRQPVSGPPRAFHESHGGFELMNAQRDIQPDGSGIR